MARKRGNPKSSKLKTVDQNGILLDSVFRADVVQAQKISEDCLAWLISKLYLYVGDFRATYRKRCKLSPYHCWAILKLRSSILCKGRLARQQVRSAIKSSDYSIAEFERLKFIPTSSK